MTESRPADIKLEEQRLHAWSWLFTASHRLKKVVFPLLAFVFFQNTPSKMLAFSVLGLLAAIAWGILQARCFRYSIADGELLVRAGILDRSLRHIPFARIQSVNQRRGPLHRLLGVTELRLESASGGKHEALMKVLSLDAAARLEDLLRGTASSTLVSSAIAPDPETSLPAAPVAQTRVLHQLGLAELIRHGLISNRSVVALAALYGLYSKNREHLPKLTYLTNLFAPLKDKVTQEYALHHLVLIFFSALVIVLTALVCLRIFSIAFAIYKYHGFRLELQGERLQAEYGLLTKMRSGARLPRLQRLVLVQGWLHRYLRRCRLAVDVIGGTAKDESGAEARLSELAPIATPEQARALLQVCIPGFDLSSLSWQTLHPAAAMRRMRNVAYWLLPLSLLLLGLELQLNWSLSNTILIGTILLLWLGFWMHARAWARFAAYAVHADWLVYRSGVITQRWIIVMPARLQSVSVTESPLDRRKGMQSLKGDAQGGSHKAYALHIPYLRQADAQSLRELVWASIAKQ